MLTSTGSGASSPVRAVGSLVGRLVGKVNDRASIRPAPITAPAATCHRATSDVCARVDMATKLTGDRTMAPAWPTRNWPCTRQAMTRPAIVGPRPNGPMRNPAIATTTDQAAASARKAGSGNRAGETMNISAR